MATLALLVCLGSTLFMTGLIWFVQVVHDPLLVEVGPDSFGRYHTEHVRRIGPLAASAMTAELASAVALVASRPAGTPGWLAIAGLIAAVAVWVSTALVQVPLHGRLASKFDPTLHQRLVWSNWARTAVWSAHALIVLAMVALAID